MSVLATVNLTLNDYLQRVDKNDNQLPIVEMVDTSGGALADLPFVEANDGDAHKTSMRTGIPAGIFRALYQAIQPEKSTVTQVSDTCGNLESLSEIDYDLARKNGMSATWMLGEQIPFLEGLGQTMRRAFWYGDEKTNIAGFTGLNVRFNSKTAANGRNIIDAGGSGDGAGYMQSAWLLTLGVNTLHGIFPKGSTGGMEVTPSDGVPVWSETFNDETGVAGKMRVLRSHYKWMMGVCLRDWRYQARVCNISVKPGPSVSASVFDGSTTNTNYATNLNNLLNAMIRAKTRVKRSGIMGTQKWYVSQQVYEALTFAILNKLTNNLTWSTVAGEQLLTFMGIPVEVDDALSGLDADGVTSLEPVVS